jgi:hypothetical protein
LLDRFEAGHLSFDASWRISVRSRVVH